MDDRQSYSDSLAKEFERWRLADPTLFACLKFAEYRGLTEIDGMRLAIVELAKKNDALLKNLARMCYVKAIPIIVEANRE